MAILENNLPICDPLVRDSRTMDTLANLKAFLAVERTGSFAAAARELRVARSVVTKRISQIEWRMQARLFERTSRAVGLTPVGLHLLPAVKRVVADMEGLFVSSKDSATELSGNIRLKVPTSLGVCLVAPLLRSFQRAHPLISLDIVVVDRSVNPVDEGFDLCLTLKQYSFGGVIDIPLRSMAQFVCASPQYLIGRSVLEHPVDLLQHDLLNFSPSGNRWEFGGPAGALFADIQPKLATNEGQILLAAALDGLGIALLSEYLAGPEIAAGNLLHLLPDYPVADLWLKIQIPENRSHIERVRALVQWLKDGLAN